MCSAVGHRLSAKGSPCIRVKCVSNMPGPEMEPVRPEDPRVYQARKNYTWWRNELAAGRVDVIRDFHWLLADLAQAAGKVYVPTPAPR
jgi:hypothetical protein